MTTADMIKTANKFEAKVIAEMSDEVYAAYMSLSRDQRAELVFGAMRAAI